MKDLYTAEILMKRFYAYKKKYIETLEIIKETGLPIRQENPPEDITENIVKFILHRGDDPSCMWAKSIKKKGDLYSTKYDIPEVKSFTSNGPSSFGPKKVFGVIYFLDLRKWLDNQIILWKVNLTNESPEWKNLKMNKTQTHQEQCDEKRRPHISWDKIYEQLNTHCEEIYNGTFEDIFV